MNELGHRDLNRKRQFRDRPLTQQLQRWTKSQKTGISQPCLITKSCNLTLVYLLDKNIIRELDVAVCLKRREAYHFLQRKYYALSHTRL